MSLTISFSGNGLLSPTILIRDGEKTCLLKHPRWVQFFCLMAHRSIQSIDHGWVELEDLTHLLALRNIPGKRIAKFLSESYSVQPVVVKKFMEAFVHFKPSGPYRLILPIDLIHTDAQLLMKYLSFIFHPSSEAKTTLDESFETANRELNSYELGSSVYLLQNCLESLQQTGARLPIYAPMICINLATALYLASDNTTRQESLLTLAEQFASKLRDSKYRRLFESFILDRRIWMAPAAEYNGQRLFKWNSQSMELASMLPKDLGDRGVIIAGRLYFKLYNSVRYGSKSVYRQTLGLIRDLYRMAEETGRIEFVPFERDMFLAYEAQSELIDVMRWNIRPGNDCLEQYENLTDNKDIPKINILSIAEWMTNAFQKANQPEAALEFVTEALIQHSQLYQTTIFTRLKVLRAQLKQSTKVG